MMETRITILDVSKIEHMKELFNTCCQRIVDVRVNIIILMVEIIPMLTVWSNSNNCAL